MAGLGLKCVFLISLLIAALVVQAEADATVVNADITGGSPVVFYVDGKEYSVGVTAVDVKVEGKHQQAIVVKGANGKDITVNVSNGDVVVVVPDFSGGGSGIVVSVNGNQFH